MLFGRPLSTRGEQDRELRDVGVELDRALRGVHNAVLTGMSANASALAQARVEWMRVVDMEATYAGVMAKRAALLYAGWVSPGVLEYWKASDAALVASLRDFALPLVMPSFVRGMAQCPDSMVVMVSVLCDMWGPEWFVR
tara:strand:+ start:12796 stop:13215 length:420 start_codon:yes stop_codon:yes gene_type:complete